MKSRPKGSVRAAGAELIVSVAGDSTANADVIATLTPLGGKTSDDGTTVAVPATKAAQLRDALSHYPTSRIQWLWDEHAELVLQEQTSLAEALNTIVATPVDSQSEDLDALAGSGFTRELKTFQRQHLARLLFMRNGANFSVPGSGKTTVALAAFAALRRQGVVDVMLVFAPTSAFETWEAEVEECFTLGERPTVAVRPVFSDRDADILILNYERLELRRTLAEIDTWAGNRRVLAVFDEAHRAKAGLEGLRGRAARVIAARSARRLILTGTPMPNRPSDLAAVFDLAWPGQGSRLATGDLATARERVFVRATKDDLDLPKLDMRIELVELEPAHRTLYDALEGKTADGMSKAAYDAREIGRAVMRLIAAAVNPAAVVDPGSPFGLPARASRADFAALLDDPTAYVRPAKLVRAAQLVAANAAHGRKTLVWSNFVRNVAALREVLADHDPALITGATPFADNSAATDRQRELARFRSDPQCHVLIATPQTLGEGVSLHKVCFDQVHVDRGFAAGMFLQSLDRTHRLGMDAASSPSCTVLVAAETIDEAVHAVLSKKVNAMAAALNDASLAPVATPIVDDSLTLDDLLLGESSENELRKLLEHVLR